MMFCDYYFFLSCSAFVYYEWVLYERHHSLAAVRYHRNKTRLQVWIRKQNNPSVYEKLFESSYL